MIVININIGNILQFLKSISTLILTVTEKPTTIKNLSFQITKISNGNNRVIRPGITVNITLDAYNADKELIKKSLQQIFTEALEYFD